MALTLYRSTNSSDEITELSPFSISFDGRIGGAQCKRVFLRNDDERRWYDSIVFSVGDSDTPSLVDGSTAGWQVKLSSDDIVPTEEGWGLIAAGNTLSLGNLGTADLGDVVTYLPIWIRIEVPRGQSAQNIVRLSLMIEAQEGVV